MMDSHDESQQPVALDLFCGVGGVARGLQRLGYHVVGIDKEASKADMYPGEFIQHDLRDGLPHDVQGRTFAVAWGSPSCKFAVGVAAFRSGENMIPLARQLLQDVDAPVKIIENVPDARHHLRDPVALEGGYFGLDIRKRRYFETNFRATSRLASGRTNYEYSLFDREHPVEGFREAHGFDADCELGAKHLREAIPPVYVEELLAQAERAPASIQATVEEVAFNDE